MSDIVVDDEDEDFTPVRSERARSSPLRFVTPGTFGLAAILFFLPWTELSCSGPGGRMQLVTQSGLQSASGTFSEGEELRAMREKEEKKTGKKADKLNANELRGMAGAEGGHGKDGPEKAHLLWAYFGLVLAAAIVPLAVPSNRPRGAIVATFATFAGLAIAALVVQLVIGMPLANAADESNAEAKKAEGMMGPAAKGDLDELRDMMKMKCSYLPSFWFSMLALAASLVLGLVQLVPGGSKAPSRRRAHEDEEDEEDDGA